MSIEKFSSPETIARVRLLMASHGLDEEKLSEKSGVSLGEISRFFSHPKNAPLRVLNSICQALNVTTGQMLDMEQH